MSKLANTLCSVLGIRTINSPIVAKEKLDLNDELMPLYKLSLELVDEKKKQLIYDEMLNIQKGFDGEKQILYELKNTGIPMVILQDIRVEVGEQTAQIDFVLITTKLIILIEGKKLIGDIDINKDGDFLRSFKSWNGKVYKKENMYSPFVQNKRHKLVLESLFMKNKINNRFPIVPLVLLSNPKSILNKKYAPAEVQDSVFKAEQIGTVIEKIQAKHPPIHEDKMIEINWFLKNNHKAISYDVKKKYGIMDSDIAPLDCEPTIDELEKFMLSIKEDRMNFALQKNNISTASKDKKPDPIPAGVEINSDMEESLKNYRSTKAKEESVPAYYIFSNAELDALLLQKPIDIASLKLVKGFGDKKIEKYGHDILNIINGH